MAIEEKDPVEIARLLEIRYDGIQRGIPGSIPDRFQFTDVNFTRTTFYGVNLEEAFDRLVQVRQRWNKSGRGFPIPSFPKRGTG
ncbi:hypothetical protein ES703_100840 [subsurface metagenome]